MLDRMRQSWVYGGSICGLLLLALAPILTAGWDRAPMLAFLLLPAYMLHQLEEHDDDRFRRFINSVIGQGREVLTLNAVFWINILGVWALLGGVLWLVRVGGAGWAALAGWLVVVNALVHVGPAIGLRRYNPGLVTAILLFLPLGIATLRAAWPLATGAVFWGGLVVAVSLHLAIMLHVRSRLHGAPVGAA